MATLSQSHSQSPKNNKLEWTPQQEQLLINWAEKASGYTWLHSKSINLYKRRNIYISIPASIFGYIAGAATLLSNDKFNETWLKSSIGICGIFAGILANLQQMFTFKELSEQHRISSLRFLSFFRDISCELSMHPKHRNSPIDYITIKRLELDKMLEQSPSIPDVIITQFNNKTTNMDRNFHKPDIANILQTIVPYHDVTCFVNDDDDEIYCHNSGQSHKHNHGRGHGHNHGNHNHNQGQGPVRDIVLRMRRKSSAMSTNMTIEDKFFIYKFFKKWKTYYKLQKLIKNKNKKIHALDVKHGNRVRTRTNSLTKTDTKQPKLKINTNANKDDLKIEIANSFCSTSVYSLPNSRSNNNGSIKRSMNRKSEMISPQFEFPGSEGSSYDSTTVSIHSSNKGVFELKNVKISRNAPIREGMTDVAASTSASISEINPIIASTNIYSPREGRNMTHNSKIDIG
jgi:hypothetical protein